jgi:hypothetical protein
VPDLHLYYALAIHPSRPHACPGVHGGLPCPSVAIGAVALLQCVMPSGVGNLQEGNVTPTQLRPILRSSAHLEATNGTRIESYCLRNLVRILTSKQHCRYCLGLGKQTRVRS